jgi:hypothetical protein
VQLSAVAGDGNPGYSVPAFPQKVRQGKPGEGGWCVEVNQHIETFYENSQV